MRFPERGLHVSWSFWLLILLAAIVSPLTIVLSILLAAALHECGHLLALRAFHVPIEGLRLSAFGAVLHARGAQRLSYGRELVVTLAGCGMNLVCGVLTAWFSLHYVWVEGFVFAGAHILLCAFNLLPIPPLDGSHALNLAVSALFGPARGRRGRGACGRSLFTRAAGRGSVSLCADARRRARYFCRTGTAFKRAQRTETCASRNKSVE